MILSTLWWLLLLLGGLLGFQQNQYELTFERLEVVSFNTTVVAFAKTHNFKHNRTQAATVYTIHMLVVVGSDLKLEVQAYKKASNEYREFPLRFMFDYCDFVARKEFGLEGLFACGNSTGCPFAKKGIYRSCVWAPNSKKFPPGVPAGNYMLEMKFFHNSVEYVFLQLFGSVKYPECKGCDI